MKFIMFKITLGLLGLIYCFGLPALATEVEKILIPSGPFQMGTESGTDWESPVHTVQLDAYFLDRFEVSNDRFQTFDPQYRPSALSACPACPATGITWYQADAYCRAQGGRLPTEAEWEKAARGPQGHDFTFGPKPDPQKIVYAQPFEAGAKTVDSSAPNGYGLHHMNGNVWEWVQDWSGSYTKDEVDNPEGPVEGVRKIVRGGGWYSPPYFIHAGMRFRLLPTAQLNALGFRCAYDEK